MFKPLFKYKGGKYEEYKKFNNFLPKTINNYYEPFFGSGGVFFRLQNENKIKGSSFINDYSKSLNASYLHSIINIYSFFKKIIIKYPKFICPL